jgi:hypothetical protein
MESGDAHAAISMPSPTWQKATDLLQVWAKLPGLTLPAGGIRSVDGHDY